MATTDNSFPVFLSRDIPQFTGTLGSGDSIVVLLKNNTLARVNPTAIATSVVKVAVPSASYASGQTGQIAWDNSGIYVYSGGTWAKSPSVTTHWEDFTQSSRFLRVDAEQNLDETEMERGRSNLNIHPATKDLAGLVKKIDVITQDMEMPDNTDTVASVAALLKFMYDNKQVISEATNLVAGIVRLANSIEQNSEAVPTAGQVWQFVTEQVGNGAGKSVDLTNYKGPVSISGPNGEILFKYNSESKTLQIGSAKLSVAGNSQATLEI